MDFTETPRNHWQIGHNRTLPLDDILVMGVLNITPDSFSDGGMFLDIDAAVAHGVMMARTGADIIDVGGESTRPGSEPIDAEEQIRRVTPVIRRLRDERPELAISIDTRLAVVADAALDAGAHIVNDISSLRDDPELGRLVARRRAGLVLMHMKGAPRDMQRQARYDDVVGEVHAFLRERVDAAVGDGVAVDQIVIDPGIGFGKTLEHNLKLLANIGRLADIGPAVLVGPSRKRFIGDIIGAPVNERLAGTLASCVLAVCRGAKIVRVHNPAPVRQAIAVALAICQHTDAAGCPLPTRP